MTAMSGEHGPAAAGASAADAAGGLGFPDVPRLELDQLLVQLVDRAGDVLAAQGRLRGLLRANALVAGDLSLPVVLRQIVGAARDLLGARYAALGVIGRDGELEQFVHAGMDDALVAEIGDLPRGRGILGLLISEPVPIRLADLSAHPAAAGFPPGHPPMGSFLGVPVRIGEEVFGNLYLTERIAGGEFTADDEQLAIALAAAAGAAIANARRYAESEQRRRWLDASAQLTPLLLADSQGQPHALITGHAADAADADFAILAVPRDPDQVIVTGAAGAAGRGTGEPDSAAGRLAGRAGDPHRQAEPGHRRPPRDGSRGARRRDRPADRRPAGGGRAGPRRAAAGAGWPHAPGSPRPTWAWPPPSPAMPPWPWNSPRPAPTRSGWPRRKTTTASPATCTTTSSRNCSPSA